MQKRLEAQAELRPDATVIKIDVKAAFQNMRRSDAVQAIATAVPEVARVLLSWYAGQSTQLWRDTNGKFSEIRSNKGFDQGCPLAAAAFSIAQTAVLEPFIQQLRQADPHAKLYSYLDDTYVVVAKEHAAPRIRWT